MWESASWKVRFERWLVSFLQFSSCGLVGPMSKVAYLGGVEEELWLVPRKKRITNEIEDSVLHLLERRGYVASFQGTALHNILTLDGEITFVCYNFEKVCVYVDSFYLPIATIPLLGYLKRNVSVLPFYGVVLMSCSCISLYIIKNKEKKNSNTTLLYMNPINLFFWQRIP